MTPRTTAWKKTRYIDPIDVDWKSFEVVSLCHKFYGEGPSAQQEGGWLVGLLVGWLVGWLAQTL